MSSKLANTNNDEFRLVKELSQLIDESKKQVVVQANSSLTLLFWQVGNRINQFTLQNKRATYGKHVIVSISEQLVALYGRNFETKNLRRMIQFSEIYADYQIVVSLTRQLTWTHIIAIIPLKSVNQRGFYIQKITEEKWNTRCTRKQIETKAYERTVSANTQNAITRRSLSNEVISS